MSQLLRAAFVFVILAMLWVTVVASQDRSVLQAAQEIWADPWGKATLFDTYFAFFTVWLWMAYREPNWTRRLLWLLGVIFLGNFVIAAYFLIALGRPGKDEDWTKIFRPVESS